VLEAVLLSITPSYVSSKVHEKSVTGILLEKYKKDIDRPLSAILTLNTIAHTVGAIGVGVQAGKLFGANHIDLGLFSISYESLIAGIMTLAILILSEIIPKTIGANNWKMLAPFTIKTIRILIMALAPLVWLSQKITKSLNKNKEKSILSRSDFTALTMVGKESGALNPSESAIIKNLLGFERLVTRDIMTPKTVSFMVDQDVSIKEFYEANQPIPFSRIPSFSETRDNVKGIVLKDDVLQELVEGKGDKKIESLNNEVFFVRDTLPLPKLFDELIQKGHYLSVVVDDYGSMMGLVTLEDLVETMLGIEIVDETDKVEDLQKMARQRWEVRQKGKNAK
jgi:CBS domain containing-hemolysin-like protein